MLEICFLILKILVICIFSVFGLLLLLLSLVLFVPIRYSSEGYKSAESTFAKGILTYLNPVVRVIVNYPDKEKVKVKILGINVYPTKTKKKKVNVKAVENSEDDKKFEDKNSENRKNENKNSKTPETKQEKDSSKSSTLDTIGYYTTLFSENKELVLNVLGTILRAFKTILPSKCKVHAVFGTGQADTTGYIYAVYCSLKDNLPGEVYLEPIWTEAHLEGKYYLKGKIRIIHFLIAFMKIITNKETRLLIKKLRRV